MTHRVFCGLKCQGKTSSPPDHPPEFQRERAHPQKRTTPTSAHALAQKWTRAPGWVVSWCQVTFAGLLLAVSRFLLEGAFSCYGHCTRTSILPDVCVDVNDCCVSHCEAQVHATDLDHLTPTRVGAGHLSPSLGEHSSAASSQNPVGLFAVSTWCPCPSPGLSALVC